MSNTDRELITELKVILTNQRYSPVVVGNYCSYASGFLDYLAKRDIAVAVPASTSPSFAVGSDTSASTRPITTRRLILKPSEGRWNRSVPQHQHVIRHHGNGR